jgi:hypothetical protein
MPEAAASTSGRRASASSSGAPKSGRRAAMSGSSPDAVALIWVIMVVTFVVLPILIHR